jgi:hypothetical protein
LKDRETIAESLRSLADKVSSAPNAHSQLTKAGVDCWIESSTREKSTPPNV